MVTGPLRSLPRLRPLLAAALLFLAAPLSAQIADSIRADSIRADSLRTDSIARRQTMQTERYLKATLRNDVAVPSLPYNGAEGPRAAGSRIVFSRDSIEWSLAHTVGDLIAEVQGTYLLRTGWLGTTAMPSYHGRSATSVTYFLDGLPYTAVGPDSVSVDPTIFALSMLERVEIEPWPGLLRVFMYSRRYDRVAPRSLIGLGRGTNNLTRFQAQLEKRSPTKLSFGLAGDYFNSGSVANSFGSFYLNTQAWAQVSYLPNPHSGLVLQYVTSSPNRKDETSSSTGTEVLGVHGHRSDLFLRGFLRKTDDGLGPNASVTVAQTSWSGDSVSQSIVSVTAAGAIRTPTASVTASAAYRTRWTPLDVVATAGWTPSPRIGVNATGNFQLISGGRSSAWVGAQASIIPISHIVLKGNVRAGSVVQAPSIEADTAQSVLEGSASIGWSSKILGAEFGIVRASAFDPLAYQPLQLVVAAILPSAATNWYEASGRFTPTNWISIDGWYSSPTGVIPQGQPPDHGRVIATLRSRFLRTFPSGAFDIKASLGFERWGPGVLGLGVGGLPVVVPSQMYLNLLVELKIQAFSIYFSEANLMSEFPGYVPGFPILGRATTFGARWSFLN